MNSELTVLVTGSNGFIGKNLIAHLSHEKHIKILRYQRNDDDKLISLIENSDVIIHLAAEIRPLNDIEFLNVNYGLTSRICEHIKKIGRKIPIIFSSSIQAEMNSPYGKSKYQGERLIEELNISTGNPAVIYRLNNIFGKWAKPNFNSVVATYCHNICTGAEIQIENPDTKLKLTYIDDLIKELVGTIHNFPLGLHYKSMQTVYEITLGELAKKIQNYKSSRETLGIENVGGGLDRCLYATYTSYLQPDNFSYGIKKHEDSRGVFVEMLKSKDSGQVSFFTVFPGITRGSHFHHTKSEKFLVIRGMVKMKFRNIITGTIAEEVLTGENPRIVDSCPGWAHDISNIGTEEALVILWSSEVFNPAVPDCIPCKV